MTPLLRILLVIASILVTVLVIRRVANSRAKIEDSLFWLGLGALLIVFSLFPGIVEHLSRLTGVQSSQNFIFLLFIFICLAKQFTNSIRISKLEMRVQELSQAIALHEEERKSETARNGKADAAEANEGAA